MRKLGARSKAALATVVVLAGGLMGGVSVAQPATAAPSCTSTLSVDRAGFSYTLPAVRGSSRPLDCVLGVGNFSSAVRTLQVQLNLCYLSNGARPPRFPGQVDLLTERLAEDSDYGPATRRAVAAVQRYHQIDDDGVYGPQTRRTIRFLAARNTDDRAFCRSYGA